MEGAFFFLINENYKPGEELFLTRRDYQKSTGGYVVMGMYVCTSRATPSRSIDQSEGLFLYLRFSFPFLLFFFF